MTGDTIAAIATAMSASGIGIIRISGDDSMEIISKVYRSKGGKKQIKEAVRLFCRAIGKAGV